MLISLVPTTVFAAEDESSSTASWITVYFTNNYNWSNVKVYYWGSSLETVEWPGNDMGYVNTNSYNESVYSLRIPSDVIGISFNNGGSYQTVDITERIYNGAGWYLQGRSVEVFKYDVGEYEFGQPLENTKRSFGSHTYQVLDYAVTWSEAKKQCEDLGGHLVTINSAAENEFLVELSKESIKRNLWIGAKTDGTQYSWITGESFSYTNWEDNEPNNVDDYQYTAMMYTHRGRYTEGKWNDENENGRNWSGYYLSDFGFVCEWESEELTEQEKEISNMLGNINFGPYALKGAIIDIMGYEIPLLEIEATFKLPISKNIKVIYDGEEDTVKVLIGFVKESADADIRPSDENDVYWSEAYQSVKKMYQNATGKKVDTTRLWNSFSSLRGKLKPIQANLLVDVDAQIAGFVELKHENGKLEFSEGGILAGFEAKASLRHYPWPIVYVALGIEAGANGTLSFVKENNKLNPQLKVEPEFIISGGAGIGTSNLYAQVDLYGKLMAEISTANSATPFRAGFELGARWYGVVNNCEVFHDDAQFTAKELYPNFGNDWKVETISLMSDVDVSTTESYNELLSSAELLDRGYLASAYSVRSSVNLEGVDFQKQSTYPLSRPRLVEFDDGTMLLVWIDDTGEKSLSNRCSLMYSYYDGQNWSAPDTVYEDGTTVDTPNVYSDGNKAYIVWQKALREFEESEELSEQLKDFDLYAIVFDSQTKTFGNVVSINTEEETVFEFAPVIFGSGGAFTVSWIENTDNNVYEKSGETSLYTASFDTDGTLLDKTEILTVSDVFKDVSIDECGTAYSVMESGCNNLYLYDGENTLIAGNINHFDCANGSIFYSTSSGFYRYNNGSITEYPEIGAIDDFDICYNNGNYALFITVLEEDFSKSLYYSRMTEENAVWSEFELYYKDGTYIRNYSPVIANDGTVYVAFNNVITDTETGTETAMIQVGQCTDEIDIALSYADFEDEQLKTGNIDLNMGIVNNSSMIFEQFEVNIIDNNGIVVLQEQVSATIAPFSTEIITVNLDIPDSYNNEKYTIVVLPVGYTDFDETNNSVVTTFECIHQNTTGWVTQCYPTLAEKGYSTYSCDICGKVLEEKEISYVALSGTSITIGGNIGVNFYLNLADEVLSDENAKVVFTLPNGGNKSVAVSDVAPDADGHYVFTCEVAAKEMASLVTAQVVTSDDKSEIFEYSVMDYADYILKEAEAGNTNYTDAAPLVKAMLNYGAAAQKYFGYNEDNLANSILNDEDKVLAEDIDLSEYKPVIEGKSNNVYYYGSTLSLNSETTIKHYFTIIDEENIPDFYVNNELVEPVKKGELYEVRVEDISAQSLDEEFVVTADGLAINYNALSYGYYAMRGSDESLKNVIKALYAYNVSADDYVVNTNK